MTERIPTPAERAMRQYAYARDRRRDREPRIITITDDEAVELLTEIDRMSSDV